MLPSLRSRSPFTLRKSTGPVVPNVRPALTASASRLACAGRKGTSRLPKREPHRATRGNVAPQSGIEQHCFRIDRSILRFRSSPAVVFERHSQSGERGLEWGASRLRFRRRCGDAARCHSALLRTGGGTLRACEPAPPVAARSPFDDWTYERGRNVKSALRCAG